MSAHRWYEYDACPVCGAGVGQRCTSRNDTESANAHVSRPLLPPERVRTPWQRTRDVFDDLAAVTIATRMIEAVEAGIIDDDQAAAINALTTPTNGATP